MEELLLMYEDMVCKSLCKYRDGEFANCNVCRLAEEERKMLKEWALKILLEDE